MKAQESFDQAKALLKKLTQINAEMFGLSVD